MLKYKVLDIETSAKRPWQGDLLCVGWGKEPYLNPADVPGAIGWDKQFLAELADPTVAKVVHTKFDVRYLRLASWKVAGPVYDTQVMAWVLNENQDLSLDALAKKYCDITMDKRIRTSSGKPVFRTDSGKEVPIASAPKDQLAAYNLRDLEAEGSLFEALLELLGQSAWLAYYEQEERPFTEILLGLETAGIPINLDALNVLLPDLQARMDEQGKALDEMLGYSGVNYGSWKQMVDVLFNKVWYQKETIKHGLNLNKSHIASRLSSVPIGDVDSPLRAVTRPKSSVTDGEINNYKHDLALKWEQEHPGFFIQKGTHQSFHGYWTRKGLGLKPTPAEIDKKTGKKADHPSTRTPALLVHHGTEPFIQELVKWRKLEKAIEFLESYPNHTHKGRLYAGFNQTGTKTGRISSSEPNLTNVPAHGELGKAIRGLFQGNLIVGDYSQLEPRVLAHLSSDPVLLDCYRNNQDIYLRIAEGLFGREVGKDEPERQISKTVFLAGPSYGAGPPKVAEILCLNGYPTTPDRAEEYLNELYAFLPGLGEYQRATIAEVKQKGYVTTLGGRHRRLSHNVKSKNWRLMGYGFRQAVNARVQGTAGDIVRRAMIACARDFPDLIMLVQVHDEIVFEHPEIVWEYKELPWLAELKHICETAHGFDLQVPLLFEPQFCTSWDQKGESGIILPEDMEEAA